jgi:hypothetical protein
VERNATAQASPSPTDVLQGLRSGPLLEGLFADREEGGATALPFRTHDRHAPLVVFAGASPTRNGLYDLDLFAGTGVLGKMADVDDAVQTDVRRFVGRWVRGCARLSRVHSALRFCGPCLREIRPSAGASYVVNSRIISQAH